MKKFLLVGMSLLLLPFLVSASSARDPQVKIYKSNLTEKTNFMAFEDMNQNGGSIAVGDLGKGRNGKNEIVIGSGPGEEPWVYIYRSDGKFIRKFLAYDINTKTGVNVAIGNVRGKKNSKKKAVNEIITAPISGGGPHVRVFDKYGNALSGGNFFSYNQDFRGGVNLASCDTNGDGRDEIITSAGPGGETHGRVFDGYGNFTGLDFRPFSSEDRGGATVACANVDGGDEYELAFAIQSYGQSFVKVYKTDATKRVIGEWKAYGGDFMGGVQITGADMDNDDFDEIVTAPTQYGGPHIRVYEAYGQELDISTMAYETGFRGGVRLASGNLTHKKNKVNLAVFPAKKQIEGRADLFKYIDVNLTTQYLQAYYDGEKVMSFYVSTGKRGYDTPTGEFKIYAKFPTLRMTGFYGENNPNNYDLANVPSVLAFYGDYTIHGAYWHHNWGHVMSHGCVNEPLKEAEELYNWANVGDVVVVHY
ncbi:MAG: L,D-transpeptidase [Patescibacteria group bacterium]